MFSGNVQTIGVKLTPFVTLFLQKKENETKQKTVQIFGE